MMTTLLLGAASSLQFLKMAAHDLAIVIVTLTCNPLMHTHSCWAATFGLYVVEAEVLRLIDNTLQRRQTAHCKPMKADVLKLAQAGKTSCFQPCCKLCCMIDSTACVDA